MDEIDRDLMIKTAISSLIFGCFKRLMIIFSLYYFPVDIIAEIKRFLSIEWLLKSEKRISISSYECAIEPILESKNNAVFLSFVDDETLTKS